MGIKCLGSYLIFESVCLALNIFITKTQEEEEILVFILSISMVICFVWSISNKESLKAREYWLLGVIAYFIMTVLIKLIGLYFLYATDRAKDFCLDDYAQIYGMTVDDNGRF